MFEEAWQLNLLGLIARNLINNQAQILTLIFALAKKSASSVADN
jgi:hypothetical protein